MSREWGSRTSPISDMICKLLPSPVPQFPHRSVRWFYWMTFEDFFYLGCSEHSGLGGVSEVPAPHPTLCPKGTPHSWLRPWNLGEHQPPTCSNHLLNFDTGDVNFLGKLPHCLIGVLIGERVDVDLHAWGHWGIRPGLVTCTDSRCGQMERLELVPCGGKYTPM